MCTLGESITSPISSPATGRFIHEALSTAGHCPQLATHVVLGVEGGSQSGQTVALALALGEPRSPCGRDAGKACETRQKRAGTL